MRRFKLLGLFVLLGLTLSSCREGDLGPLALSITARMEFHASASRSSSIQMEKNESAAASFFYDHSRERLYVSVGTQKTMFQGARFNINAGHLISSPSDSKVVDAQGLRLGVQITRSYAGGNSQITYWDYRVQIFNERSEALATGTARIEEVHPSAPR